MTADGQVLRSDLNWLAGFLEARLPSDPDIAERARSIRERVERLLVRAEEADACDRIHRRDLARISELQEANASMAATCDAYYEAQRRVKEAEAERDALGKWVTQLQEVLKKRGEEYDALANKFNLHLFEQSESDAAFSEKHLLPLIGERKALQARLLAAEADLRVAFTNEGGFVAYQQLARRLLAAEQALRDADAFLADPAGDPIAAINFARERIRVVGDVQEQAGG